jgi:hypothetical protein
LVKFTKLISSAIGISSLIPFIAHAAKTSGLGEFAEDLLEPVAILSDFISTAALILAICSLFSALLRYMQYRVNPMAAPLSSVIFLFIMGLALLAIPFLYKLTGGGIPYHLF